MTHSNAAALLLKMLLVGLAYFAGAWLGVHQTITPEGIAILWPPNAILLTAFLILPRRDWPFLAIAALLAEVVADVPAFPLWAAVGFGLVNLFEVTLAAWLIRKGLSQPFDFKQLRSGVRFLLYGPLLASALAALFGALIYILLGRADSSYLSLWRLWWFGDALGLLLLTPFLVSVWRLIQEWPKNRPQPQLLVEAAALFALIVLLGLFAFMQVQHRELAFHFTPIILLPLVMLAALRLGVLGAATSVVLTGVLAVGHLVREIHPYATSSPQYAVWLTQEYLAIIAVTGIGLAIILEELAQQRAILRLQDRAMHSINDAIFISDARQPDMPIIWVNPQFERMFGYSAAEILGKNCRFLQNGDREQPELAALRESLKAGRPGRFMLRNYHRDGSVRWIQLSLAPVEDERGEITHFVGVQHDVTEEKAIKLELSAARDELQRQNQILEERVKERTAELEHANAQLAMMATTDHLTGIANRRHFESMASKELQRLGHDGQPASLIMFDLDHFKEINDQHGHLAGDEVLRQIVQPLQRSIRPRDLCGRVGGEEFLILLSGLPMTTALEVAERIRREIEAMEIPYENRCLRVTASFGVVQWDGKDSLQDLMKEADARLYAAKQQGRNRVVGVLVP